VVASPNWEAAFPLRNRTIPASNLLGVTFGASDGTKVEWIPRPASYMVHSLGWGDAMEMAVLIFCLLVAGSQIKGNPHIILR